MNAPFTRGVEVVTFGCRLNLVESQAMRDAAQAAGERGAIIVNTCAVTAESVRQARQTIRRIAREQPGARIIVSGCAAETERAAFAQMPEVAAMIGNADKTDPAAWRALRAGALQARAIAQERTARPLDVTQIERHTRGLLAIQNGCDHRCTFCIIPYGRGPSRSLPAASVIEQARRLADAGAPEIVLTGVDLTSWGADLPQAPRLGALVRAILAEVPHLPRLRLSSLDCIEIDDDLLRALADEERLMPHLHLSLQAGDDLILKRMKRRHSRADAVRLCAELRRIRPDIALGADLIAGFPTETDAMAANTLALVEDCGLTHLHVFPFSARPGAPAARMPQVARALAAERAARLREAGAKALARHLDAQIGRRLDILTERGGLGRARDFTPVATPGAPPGQLIEGLAASHDGRRLALAAV
ncbi:MAG: tRNA (N(6)-L-threonylcarbamoyladenosine(37)-C(2))-methylthiotransferase MtaB [Hyphomicrobiales bacterium]|nr:tRNA (N(6)-L-threonylcarbamoyladenosine(37)-C(2))-methylthiotransferase MtaB [Hyphomicrobiales bacterium]